MMLAGSAGTEGRRLNADLGEAGAGQAGCLALGQRIGAALLALEVRMSEAVVLLHRSRGGNALGSQGKQQWSAARGRRRRHGSDRRRGAGESWCSGGVAWRLARRRLDVGDAGVVEEPGAQGHHVRELMVHGVGRIQERGDRA